MKHHVLTLPPDGLASVPKEDWPRHRRGLLEAAGLTYEDLSRITRKSSVYVGKIINDKSTGYTIRPLIAKQLGFQVSDLWPDTPLQYREAA